MAREVNTNKHEFSSIRRSWHLLSRANYSRGSRVWHEL
jgi:hypothetical protein